MCNTWPCLSCQLSLLTHNSFLIVSQQCCSRSRFPLSCNCIVLQSVVSLIEPIEPLSQLKGHQIAIVMVVIVILCNQWTTRPLDHLMIWSVDDWIIGSVQHFQLIINPLELFLLLLLSICYAIINTKHFFQKRFSLSQHLTAFASLLSYHWWSDGLFIKALLNLVTEQSISVPLKWHFPFIAVSIALLYSVGSTRLDSTLELRFEYSRSLCCLSSLLLLYCLTICIIYNSFGSNSLITE